MALLTKAPARHHLRPLVTVAKSEFTHWLLVLSLHSAAVYVCYTIHSCLWIPLEQASSTCLQHTQFTGHVCFNPDSICTSFFFTLFFFLDRILHISIKSSLKAHTIHTDVYILNTTWPLSKTLGVRCTKWNSNQILILFTYTNTTRSEMLFFFRWVVFKKKKSQME